MSKTKYNSIDLMKFILAIIVVDTHTGLFANCTNGVILGLQAVSALLVAPLFYIASGYLLEKKIDTHHNGARVIVKHLVSMAKIYVKWSIIYLPLAVAKYLKDGASFGIALKVYLKAFFLYGEHFNSWILWYVLGAVYALLFVYIMYRLKAPEEAILAAGFIIGVILSVFLERYDPTFARVLRAFFFIPLGLFIAKTDIDFPIGFPVFLVGFVGEYISLNMGRLYSPIGTLFVILASFGLFVMISSIQLKNSPIYLLLRTLSTTIYFVHLWIMSIYSFVRYRELAVYGPGCFLVTFTISLMLGFALYWWRYKRVRLEIK